MKEVPVSGGLVALVDDDDLELVQQFKWLRFAPSKSRIVYADRVWYEGRRLRHQLMHSLIIGVRGIDHRNMNGLDNQRSNLRIANQSQNGANQRARGGSSPFKGVSWSGRLGKWMAYIKVNRRSSYLGSFVSEIDAAMAYDQRAREEFGPFAALNFPMSGETSCL
jgi:hypothetical protein